MLTGKWLKWVLIVVAVSLVLPTGGLAKKKKGDEKKSPYEFKVDLQLKSTPVKDQYWTGTCWCFATISFLESEALRLAKEEVDLSEMFVVRHTYPPKALNYIRLHGRANFEQGGQSHDVLNVVRDHGLVPEEVYAGMLIEEKRHNHGELISVLTGLLDGILKRRGKRLTPRWAEAFDAVLDVYLDKPPKEFVFKDQTYTPRSFVKEYLGIDTDDYIEVTSYAHHPFYRQYRLELPDNWTYNDDYYNVPIDDLEKIVDHALKSGYTVVWDGDVSEKGFSSRKTGYAVVPEIDWEDQATAQREAKITEPVKEKEITQELRQKTFDNFTTTDDHLMHIVGLAHDQEGTKFYLTKNSNGTDRKNNGFVYLSRSYFRLKTTALTVHKESLPADLKSKLKL
jgi:bleomycin hydrolase